MKNPKTPLSVRVFKTKKFLSDKNSNLKYRLKRIRENSHLNELKETTKKVMRRIINNFRDNVENWKDRANVDEGFLIDD